MPLPGGASDKIGNRYEIRCVVRHMIDLVTGRLDWLRIEPPGEDKVDFRAQSPRGMRAYQVKRGSARAGHWTLPSLREVVAEFGLLLQRDSRSECVFLSMQAAPDLQELSERARAARSAREFLSCFVGARTLVAAFSTLKTLWGVNDANAWRLLRRIWASSIGEQALVEDTDAILHLLFDAPPGTVRAVLTDLALEAVHLELRTDDIVRHLESHAIRRTRMREPKAVAPVLLPPAPTGVTRTTELEFVASLVSRGRSTIVLSGVSGIGKTTVAAQFAAARGGPVCWVDCALVGTGLEALAAIAGFAATSLGDSSLQEHLARADAPLEPISRLVGKVLSTNRCLLVWDGLDDQLRKALQPVVDAIASTVAGGGLQLVTTQVVRESGKASAAAGLRVGRLDKAAVADMLIGAFPGASTFDVEAADCATQGHPYLVQLLVDAGGIVDLATAITSMRSEARVDPLVSSLLADLSVANRALLSRLAWLEIPFDLRFLEPLGGGAESLKELAARHLIVMAGGAKYRVHELIAHLLKSAANPEVKADAHGRAALMLRGAKELSWLEVRAMLRHARAASLHEVVKEAGAALLNYAAQEGLWGLVREAAESLVQQLSDYYPHFMLGKSLRMTGDLDQALQSYESAERLAESISEKEKARYERASVFWGLGRRLEAEAVYSELLSSKDAGTRSFAQIGMALALSSRGETKAAMGLLAAALRSSRRARAQRLESEVLHAIARIHVADGELPKARTLVRKAYAIRMSLQGSESRDVLGWFHLYESALQIEMALGNRDGARSAAHGLWRFALLSGSVMWEAQAAHALCLADPNEDDAEVVTAVERMRAIGADAERPNASRVDALVSLVMCEWSLRHHEASMEAQLDLVAIANERRLEVPVFGHLSSSDDLPENVVGFSHGLGLVLPAGKGQEFVAEIVSRILLRRPELRQHARLTVGVPVLTSKSKSVRKKTLGRQKATRAHRRKRR